MLELYSKVDPAIESFFLNIGMSERATDFLMMGVGTTALICSGLIMIGLLLMYGRLLLTSYKNMIYNKHERLRRNWSVIFIATLVIGMIGIANYL